MRRFVDELKQRWVRDEGPETWAEQQRGTVASVGRLGRDALEMLQPLSAEGEEP